MQTKSLPSINQLKQKAQKLVPKGKKAQQKEAQEKELQAQEANLSPNLITPIATKSFIMRARPKLAYTAKSLAYLTLAIFGALFITNMIFQAMLNQQEKQRDELVSEISKNSYVENTVRGISSATNLYKQTKASNPEVSGSLSMVVTAFQKGLEINSIDYKRKDNAYTINASTNKATAYAPMIAQVLKSDQVASVTIDFVAYKPQTNEYTGNFIVKLK